MQTRYKPIIILIFLVTTIQAVAQKQTFDLVTFIPPKAWAKQVTENSVQFSKADSLKGAFCMISLIKSIPGTADSKDNFNAGWENIVKEMVTASAAPEMYPVAVENGWEIQSGYSSFEIEEGKGVAMLVTATADGKMVNLIILTNSDMYEKNIADFLASLKLKKPPVNAPQKPVVSNSPVIGLWGVATTTASAYQMSISEGTIVTQYNFKADGTYSFTIKTFQYLLEHLLLTRETGTYIINGTSITIIPQKSVTEAWTKKNGDDWGKLVSTQKRQLEKATYQFSIEDYGLGAVLILKADGPTKRDGMFNNSAKDAWVYPAKSGAELIRLPEGNR
ncbi:MAG: hypothetical protein ABI480_15485 [Chitinophagaceae bacterium]